MISLRSKTVLIYDYGLFVELAVTLSKSFGRTIYCTNWHSGFPTSRARMVGSGLPGVECVDEIWPVLDEVDLFVFPDVYECGLQEHLVKMGKRVWGPRQGSELELDRVKSKDILRKAGADVGSYEVIVGLEALRDFLRKNDDQFVKVSTTRGDFETFHSKNYKESEPHLDELEHSLGAVKKTLEFVVESGISSAIESGYDGYTIDGKFPKSAMVGIEVKDKGYVGRVMKYSQIPYGVKRVNDALAPALKRYGFRGFLSTEVRCTPDGGAYLIDPTCRAPSPPSELYQVMIGNLAEIIWYGAEGILIEPEFLAKWGAQIVLNSSWVGENWQQVSFPPAIRKNVKLHNFCVIDGEYYVIPQPSKMPELGSVVAMGDTAQEAIDEVKRVAELVEGYSIENAAEAVDKALVDLKQLLKDQKPDAPVTPMQRRAEDLYRAGKISEKQLERMTAKEDA